MAKFAQYYLEYLKDNLFSEKEWDERQKHFGAYFESNDSIDFSIGEGEERKTYKHEVYHLSANKDIIVMRIANVKKKEVIQDFKLVPVRHEPPCFVIIDNRDRCRRFAIQKNKDSFNTTDSLKKIVQEVLNRRMQADHCMGIKLHPQFYPRDFYKAWRLRQYNTSCIRFNISEGKMPEQFEGEDLDDQSIMDFAIRLNEEESRKKYRSVLELNPPSDMPFLAVDESSIFIRNLVKFHANTGASIEIVTIDGSRFTCYIDDDEESDSIVTNEIDNEHLDVLFLDKDEKEDEEVRKRITAAEKRLVEFVNKMKVEADEADGKENVA
jgi:hypothetical protein